MATGSIKKPFVGTQMFEIASNADFAVVADSLAIHETATIYIGPSVMNAIVGTTGSGHSFGTCSKLDEAVVDYCLNQSYNKIWHFRATTSSSTPAFSNKTSVTLS